ncbi:MAG: glycine--tRNA ligase subunit beta [Vicinamibacterales bacterium]|jgi:glycyl-tRNA synthetase beta chain|nr:glycine--tRNA ligase subunit beta [Vicinamibacterales bacterium]MDP7691676.1 glycine--tRNA ligase subunit beta [Vicinamibacterales bacterium]HJN42961.1 glycine--tRNA ligase subunit beta [Vicinamibacterales bacterium]
MYRELLVEIGCEELPASWLPPLTRQIGERVGAQLAAARLDCPLPPEPFGTPRRLAVRVAKVADRQADLEETLTGPPVRAAFDADGQPTRAALGFARKNGVDVARLSQVETPRGLYLVYQRRERGAAARSVLGDVLAAVLRDLAFAKQMHWDARLEDGRGDLLFGRPIRWLLFLFGGRAVPFVIDRTPGALARGVAPIRAGAKTYGHRFFAKDGTPGRGFRVGSFAEYRTGLKRRYVLLSRQERRARIEQKLGTYAKRAGGVVGTAGGESSLLDEVPDLVEYPSVVAGHFPKEFLALPDEVLKTTMIHHQHYFPVVTRRGRLTEHFLAVTNTPRDNVRAIAHNSERVLIARLRDARFFWEADRSAPLASRLERLDTLRFHAKLGSYRAKAQRIEQVAARVAGEAFAAEEQTGHAARAALLAKADLTTDMVGEFPELQGGMGGIYAREDGEPEEVWRAIYYHYLPIGVTVDAPPRPRDLGTAGVSWAAVSLADKLDTLVGLFQAGEKPTGSRDPFGLRRQAHGVFRVLVDLPELTGLSVRPDLGSLLAMAEAVHEGESSVANDGRLVPFLFERLRYVLEQRGYDVRNVRAVTHQTSLAEVKPVDARRKLEVLPEFTGSADFLKLATLFKRVRNIARELPDVEFSRIETGVTAVSSSAEEAAETQLREELEQRGPKIDAAVDGGENFRAAFDEAARFGPAVDRFFTDVLVMAEEPGLRLRRLALMKRLERTILRLADVSEIVKED